MLPFKVLRLSFQGESGFLPSPLLGILPVRLPRGREVRWHIPDKLFASAAKQLKGFLIAVYTKTLLSKIGVCRKLTVALLQ
jgi:hypothetical protein